MRLAAALATIALLVGAASAGASFPGRDGAIAFYAALPSSNGLYVTAPRGAATPVAVCPGTHCLKGLGEGAVWSPDGQRLAVPRSDVNGVRHTAILGADGTLIREFTVLGSPVAWLPDGRHVAVGRAGHMLAVDAEDGSWRRITGLSGTRTWSARGDIAIANDRGIYVKRGGGPTRRVLAARRGFTFGRPDWSPDGRRLAVVRTDRRNNRATLITIGADGRGLRTVVRPPASCPLGDPAWSPSGTRIAFATACLDAPGSAGADIYTVAPTGGPRTRVLEAQILGPEKVFASTAISWQPRP